MSEFSAVLECKQVSGDPNVMPLLLRAASELVEQGLTIPVIPFDWNDSALYIQDPNGHTVAVMVYKHIQWQSTLWISLTYVMPGCRRIGLYEKMYLRLREIAKAMESVRTIAGGVNANNLPMMHAAQSVGRRIEYQIWTEHLKK